MMALNLKLLSFHLVYYIFELKFNENYRFSLFLLFLARTNFIYLRNVNLVIQFFYQKIYLYQ
jgi:hypothetical protein